MYLTLGNVGMTKYLLGDAMPNAKESGLGKVGVLCRDPDDECVTHLANRRWWEAGGVMTLPTNPTKLGTDNTATTSPVSGDKAEGELPPTS